MNKSLISDNEIFQKIFETKETYEIPINMNLIKLELNKRSIKRNKTIHKQSILKYNEINIIKIHNNHIFSNNKKKTHINKLLKIQFFYGVELKNIYALLCILVSVINFIFLMGENLQKKLIFKSSEISLKIKNEGNITLFSNYFFLKYNNCEIYLDNILIDKDKNVLDFDSIYSENSIIKIIFNDAILTARNMFTNCSKILEIDLSNLDTSKVKDMSRMFYNCNSLVTINFQILILH